MAKAVEQLEQVTIRFAGDSGDGMQLTGDRFTSETAVLGNDLSTLPDFPAEIRAPAGSLPGVSGFQLHFADHDILTPGDAPNVLVAMNPAALKTNIGDLPKGGTLIVDTDTFKERNLQKAGYETSPLEDGSLADYHVHEVALTSMTVEALKGIEGITSREAERSKNFFALGLMCWLYNRPTEGTLEFVEKKFAKRPEIAQANATAFKAGYAYGETSEDFAVSYEIAPAKMTPGVYRQITGNTALAYGLIAASKLSGLDLFLGAYPITPASSILEELARHKNFGVRTFQAEDEIAAVGAALGAAFGGSLGVTTSAGPGIVLKQETIGLAIMLELPLLILDIQRAGPSTGMPTKPEQADLLMVLFGRNSREPGAGARGLDAVAVLPRRDRGGADRAQVPHAGLPALRRVPRERLRAVADPRRRDAARHLDAVRDRPATSEFLPYARDPETLARPWAIPGTPGLEHRIGGLEKADVTGTISYDPENHDLMTRLRAREGGRDRGRHPRARGRRPRRRRHARARLGLDVRPDRRRGAARAPSRAQRRAGAPPLPEPVPAQHGRGAAPLRQGAHPGDEPRPAAEARARRVPRRRGRLQPRARHAVQGARARGRDHGAGGVVRPKKKTPDRRGVLLKEQPFSYRHAQGRHGRDPLEAAAGDDAHRRSSRRTSSRWRRRGSEPGAAAADGEGDRQLQAREREADAMSDGQRQLVQLTAKDFKSDQEVRWCPGCGDYAILTAIQCFMPELGLDAREHRLRLRDRLRRALPVLHADLRDALDPRPRAGDRDRAVACPARISRSGS